MHPPQAGSPPLRHGHTRMTRRLFNLLTLVSLLLCVAVAALWVRSYGYGDVLTDRRAELLPEGSVGIRSTTVMALRGGIGASGERDVFPAAYFKRIGATAGGEP